LSYLKKITLLLFFLAFFMSVFGQQNQEQGQKTSSQKDSINIIKSIKSSRNASLLSILPGLGQIYNGKYWKVPIIYGGGIALIYSYRFYQGEYDRFRAAYKNKVNNLPLNDPQLENVPATMLYNVRESYRESRDLSLIGLVGLYVLNILDAAVDAHLKEFEINKNLNGKISPESILINNDYYFGLSLKINIQN